MIKFLLLLIIPLVAGQWVLLDPASPPIQSTDENAQVGTCKDAPTWCIGDNSVYSLSSNGFWKFEVDIKRWFWQPETPVPMINTGQWSVNSLLYLYDGSVSIMWVYNTNTRVWTPYNSVVDPGPCVGSSVWSHLASNKLFLFGGSGSGNCSGGLWAYDLHTNQWSTVSTSGTAPSSSTTYGAATLGKDESHAYVFAADKMWQLDMQSFVWSQSPTDATNPPGPDRTGHVMWTSSSGADILIFGGIAGSKLLEDTWAYSVNDKKWTFKGNTGPSAREAASYCINHDGYIVMFGGKTGPTTLTNDVWKYGPFTAQNVFEMIEWKLDSATLAATIAAAGVIILLVMLIALCIYTCIKRCVAKRKQDQQYSYMMRPPAGGGDNVSVL